MSDTEAEPQKPDKITKEKSPGRVAAGKKLAEMNKKNKTKKEEPDAGWDINWGYVIGVTGIALTALNMYWQYKPKKAPEPQVIHRPVEPPKSRVLEME